MTHEQDMNPSPVKNSIDADVIYFSLESYYKSKSLRNSVLIQRIII